MVYLSPLRVGHTLRADCNIHVAFLSSPTDAPVQRVLWAVRQDREGSREQVAPERRPVKCDCERVHHIREQGGRARVHHRNRRLLPRRQHAAVRSSWLLDATSKSSFETINWLTRSRICYNQCELRNDKVLQFLSAEPRVQQSGLPLSARAGRAGRQFHKRRDAVG